MIESLIDKKDSSELVREKIADILAMETASQQSLATAAAKDPDLWTFRITEERANPWDVAADGASLPIINVAVDNVSLQQAASDQVEKQRYEGTFNVDCYGFGESSDDGAGGHVAGDLVAAREAQRAVRFARNVLMAARYTYLEMRGTVGKRQVRSVTHYQPSIEGQPYIHVVAARMSFVVEFVETSPQVEGSSLETVYTAVRRESTGEVLAEYQKEFTS